MSDGARELQPEPIKQSWSDVDPRWGIKTTPAMVMQLELAEEEYICGEVFDKRRDGSFLRLYPDIGRVANKFGIPQPLLEEIAVRNDWAGHRQKFQEKVSAELRSMQAKVQALTIERTIEMIDLALDKFGKKVEDGEIEIDTPADFERFVRLKQFLQGKADSRVEHNHGILPLAEIQARYRGIQAQAEEETLEMSGLLVDESAIDAGEYIPPADALEGTGEED